MGPAASAGVTAMPRRDVPRRTVSVVVVTRCDMVRGTPVGISWVQPEVTAPDVPLIAVWRDTHLGVPDCCDVARAHKPGSIHRRVEKHPIRSGCPLPFPASRSALAMARVRGFSVH